MILTRISLFFAKPFPYHNKTLGLGGLTCLSIFMSHLEHGLDRSGSGWADRM